MVLTFDDKFDFRLRNIERLEIISIINKNQDLYEDISHFCRVAIMRLINRHKNGEEVEDIDGFFNEIENSTIIEHKKKEEIEDKSSEELL